MLKLNMTTIFFLRHGEYKNLKNILPLRLPYFALSDKGRKDIEKLIPMFKKEKISAIYSSPILRCKQTAEIVSKGLKLKINYSNLLTELGSPYQGITFKEFEKLKNFYANKYHLENGGEKFEEVFGRMDKILSKVAKQYSGKKVLIVSHADPMLIYFLKKSKKKVDLTKKITMQKSIEMAGVLKFEVRG